MCKLHPSQERVLTIRYTATGLFLLMLTAARSVTVTSVGWSASALLSSTSDLGLGTQCAPFLRHSATRSGVQGSFCKKRGYYVGTPHGIGIVYFLECWRKTTAPPGRKALGLFKYYIVGDRVKCFLGKTYKDFSR